MAIDTSGEWPRGDDFDDLAEYVRTFKAGGYPVDHVRASACRMCDGLSFRVLVDDEQGCALRTCVTCGAEAPIGDSADHVDAAELELCACPCGGETFSVGVGYAMHLAGGVRWLSVGMRCLTDNTLGVYVDWKIDYEPSAHLLNRS